MLNSEIAKIAQETSPDVIEDARAWLRKQFAGHEDMVASLSDAEVIYWVDGYYSGWNYFLRDRT